MHSGIILKTPAKINIGLWIEKRRDDGYHNIKTIFVPVSIFDEVILKKAQRIICKTSIGLLPQDEKNIAHKAALEFFNYIGIKRGVYIYIKKNIPVGKGLGGGSSDAAAVINGLCKLYKINLSYEKRIEIARKIGADVAFFISPRPAIAEERGDRLSYFKSSTLHFIIFSPDFNISTSWAYSSLKHLTNADNCIKILKERLIEGRFEGMDICEFNSFEEIVFKRYPKLWDVKKALKEEGAYYALLSGSGSAVYGIFDKGIIKPVFERIKKRFKGDWFLCKMV